MAVNKDRTAFIAVDLPLSVWGILALQADALDMKLGDYIIDLSMRKAALTEGMTLAPDEWLKYAPEYEGVILMDPDGWNRANFDQSWAEQITREEMKRRMDMSSQMISKKKS